MALETLKNNRYRIVRPLGSGSTGEVYLVEDNSNNRQELVLKLLHAYASPLAQEAQGASRAFRFEAGAIVQLNHPNILPLLDYGTETIDGEVVPFIVTHYRREGSLETWLERRSDSDVLTLEDAARIVRQIADALQYAHNQGVIHRDVKSANIFYHNKLNGPPDMLVADFGFARPLPEARASGQDIRGTPGYMAPEQWDGQVVPASDQYALGVLIYQLLTGHLPFEGSVEQLRDAHHNSWPTPPSTINPTLSRDLDAIVRNALAKKPGDRYTNVSAFADAFTQATQPVPEPVAPAPAYLAAPPTPPEEINVGNVTVTPPPPTPTRQLSTGMIALITTLALLVVLGSIFLIASAFSNISAQASANATATANTNATATVAPAAALSGNWVNVDSKTLGITKMSITNEGTNVTVHVFSKCSPTDCNWGTQSNKYTGSPFKIVFVVNGRSRNLAISTQGTQLTVAEGIRTYLFSKG